MKFPRIATHLASLPAFSLTFSLPFSLAFSLGISLTLPGPAVAQPTMPVTAPNAEGARTVALLQQLIRFDTSNPTGDTAALAAFLRTQFEPLGVQTDVIVAPNGKAVHFIARLKGDGSKKPVLLAAHADVVPVERDKWSVEPFAGIEKDGFVYGRGAMDFKGGMAVFARAVMRLAEQKVPLARDVIFLAEADEEEGQYNTSWLAKDHWDKMDAEFALNEGGYILQGADGAVRQVNVTTVEKTSVVLRLRTNGPVGHASRPLPSNETANGKLIAALEKLSVHEPGIRLIPQTRGYLEALARQNPGPTANAVRKIFAVADGRTQALGERELMAAQPANAPLLRALMHNTMAITMIKSGQAANVIPGQAEAIINARLLPGATTDQLIDEVRRVVGDDAVNVDFATPVSQEATRKYYQAKSNIPESSTDTELYRALRTQAAAVWPQAQVVPVLFEAGTDAVAWRERGVPVYGIYPYPLDADILKGMHGHDERIAVRSLYEGTDWVYRVLLDVAKK